VAVTIATRRQMLVFQRNEITEHHIYKRLADSVKNPENQKILLDISEDELRHALIWKNLAHQEVGPNRIRIWLFYWIGRIFGFTFSIKLMERGEDSAQEAYERLAGIVDGIDDIVRDENDHEVALIGLLDEDRLKYMGSIVLGLNDALVELTGSLAGLTLALRNSRLIALTGLIVGFAAALSMGASEYLSTKTEKESGRDPLKSSFYTGLAYIVTVAVLILPFLTQSRPLFSLAMTLAAALMIIALFNFYLSVARDEPFQASFLEMAGVSLGVAAISFGIGYLVRVWLEVEV